MKTDIQNSGNTPTAGALKLLPIPVNALLFLILPISSKLSRWAQNNPIKTRVFIAIGHVLAVVNALILGISLFFLDVGASKVLLIAVSLLVGVCFVLYPLKRQVKFNYVKQRVLDFSFVILYTACIALSLNNSLQSNDSTSGYTSTNDQPQAVFVVNSARKNQSPTQKNVFTKAKEKFQQFKANLNKQKRSPDKRKAVLALTFTILGGIMLAFGVAVGSCALACSGYAALAISALVLGAGLVFLVFFFGLRRFRLHRDNHHYIHGNDDEDYGGGKRERRKHRHKRKRTNRGNG